MRSSRDPEPFGGGRPFLNPLTSARVVSAICSSLAFSGLQDDECRPLLKKMTLEAPAVHAHMTPNYLVRLFTRTVGLPPMAYLRRRRLELATRLLIHSDLLVGEVGNSVGWSDANYFTRRFRAEFGVTPTGYRERHRQGREVALIGEVPAHRVGLRGTGADAC